MTKSFLACLFILLLLTKCKENEQSISVSGYVINGRNPVSEVKVDLDGLIQYETTTDANGRFEIKNVPLGKHDLNMKQTLADESFSTRSEEIDVTQSLVLNAIILPEPVQLQAPLITGGFTEDRVSLKWNRYNGEGFREYKLYKHPTAGLDETTGELIYVTTDPADTTFELVQPHSSEMFFRVFVLDETSLLAGSNLINATTQAYTNPTSVEIGQEAAFYLNAGEILWVKFSGERGELYKIAWFDQILSEPFPHIPGYETFGDYTASILVSAYRADKQTPYFPETVLMQMGAAPMPVAALENEDVYLKIRGVSNSVTGTFGVKVDKLDKAGAQEITVNGESVTVPMGQGEMKLLYFEGVQDQKYAISSIATIKSVCCGDGILMHISSYREDGSAAYFYQQDVALKNGDQPAIDLLNAVTSEKVYIVIDGSYWFVPNSAVINVVTQ